MDEMCVSPRCDQTAAKRMPANAAERRKLNYPGKERFLLLCVADFEMCVGILGYDPMYRDETMEGIAPAV